MPRKRVTICVLTYGNYYRLARRILQSILRCCRREDYELVVGANAVCKSTLHYLNDLKAAGHIDRVESSSRNLNKCPMMRRMFQGIKTEFIWWFDDDSYVTRPTALRRRIRAADRASSKVVMWGHKHYFGSQTFTHLGSATDFVRTADWYRGLPPPSWRPGGKGEFHFMGRNQGDGLWYFIPGGEFFIRTRTVRALNWPDSRLLKNGDDVFLGEAVRQHGWVLGALKPTDVIIGDAPRRGDVGIAKDDSIREGVKVYRCARTGCLKIRSPRRRSTNRDES